MFGAFFCPFFGFAYYRFFELNIFSICIKIQHHLLSLCGAYKKCLRDIL